MSRAEDAAIEARIARLEREARRWRRLAGGAVLGLVAIALMGQARPGGRVVEAERFVLRDGNGIVRAELGVDGDHSVARRVKDDTSMPRLTVGVENGSSVIVLNDKTGKLTAGLVSLPHGSPALSLYDLNGKTRAELVLLRDGVPALTLSDRDGFLAWKTP